MITSLDNPKVKELVKIYNNSKYRKEKGLYIVEGPHLVLEAIKANVLIEAFTVKEELTGELISEQIMKKICSTNTIVPQIGVCRIINKNSLENRILLLDGIQDPGNMGTLMRSSVAFDFNTVVIGKGCVDIYNDKVIRSSQGAIFKLNFIYEDISIFVKSHNEYKFYSTNVSNGVVVDSIAECEKIGIILGNEGKGVSEKVRKLGLDELNIRLKNTESLNVSVAGSILMYEISKK